MIGLSHHGLTALKSVPGLYEDYVSKVGVKVDGAVIYVGSTKIVAKDENPNNFVVDRNYIVRAIARFLNDKFKETGKLSMRYNTRVNFVDGDKKRVFVTNSETGMDEYLPYDLLLGCDGVRSAVRAALVAKHRDFECSVSDIFAKFKAAHLDVDQLLHKGVPIEPNLSHVFPGAPPKFNGIALVETGGKINVNMGFHKNHETEIPQEVFSEDPKVVAQFFRDHFKPFTLPYDDLANQWVKQQWSTTGMVHCNFYHSLKMSLIIMGDAAHATSPAIGQGMNTALADALAFDELLDKHGDDLQKVLPAFSEERVKEGNALSALSLHAYSLSPSQQFRLILASMVRMFLHGYFPSLVAIDPLVAIGKGEKLSKVYNDLTHMGRLPAVRTVFENIQRRHFEKTTGMVIGDPDKRSTFWIIGALFAVSAAAAATAFAVSA